MPITKTMADVDDGSLVAEGTYSGTGAAPYRKATRQGGQGNQGVTVQVDTQRDPQLGDRLPIGMFGYGANPPGANGSGVVIWEGFTRHKTSDGFALPPGGYVPVTASLRVTHWSYKYNDEGGWYANDSIRAWNFDWSSPLGSSSWFDLENARINTFPDLNLNEVMSDRSTPNDQQAMSALYEGGAEKLLDQIKTRLAAGADAQFVWTTASQLEDFPRSRYWACGLTSASNTAVDKKFRPHLIVRSMKTHVLNGLGGASIQMTDGTAVFLRKVGTAINLYYQRIGQSSPTLIRKIPTTSAEESIYFKPDLDAFQGMSLCRDNANNIFVVGMDGRAQPYVLNTFRPFIMSCFKYSGNYAWQYWSPTTGGDNSLGTLQSPNGVPNNFAPVWVPNSDYGSAGQVVVVFSHRDSQWGRFQLGVFTMYAGWLMGDTSPGKRAATYWISPPNLQSYWRPMNSVGTGLDAVRASSNDVRLCSYYSALQNDEVERHGAGQATLGSDHSLTNQSILSSTLIDAPHDPDGKARQVWMGDTPTYSAYMRSGRLGVRKISDNSLYRDIDFTGMGLTNFPSKAQIEVGQAWDVIWDSLRNKFWIYYMDSQNNRNIRKVGYDHINNVLDSSFQLNGSVLGASGDRIVALRAPRAALDPRCVLLDVAMVNNVGDPQTLINLRDLTMNKAPAAPLLDSISAFNATAARQFVYMFNDPGDTCSAHQLQIRRVSTGATVYDSGKTAPQVQNAASSKYLHNLPASTLSNDTAYQIRILTYDSVDQVGTWSDWVSFSTSGTGGTVTITQPVADLVPLAASSVTVQWTYKNTDSAKVQNGYQVKVYNDATNALISDSGIVASTATSRTLTGLVSDVRVRIEVQVRDSSGGLSGAGIRILFPDFDNPPTPMIDVKPMDGYMEVRVTNPPPSGENPVAVSNQIARKETGTADSTYKIIGTCGLNGIFNDYTVASGTDYTYKARSST